MQSRFGVISHIATAVKSSENNKDAEMRLNALSLMIHMIISCQAKVSRFSLHPPSRAHQMDDGNVCVHSMCRTHLQRPGSVLQQNEGMGKLLSFYSTENKPCEGRLNAVTANEEERPPYARMFSSFIPLLVLFPLYSAIHISRYISHNELATGSWWRRQKRLKRLQARE